MVEARELQRRRKLNVPSVNPVLERYTIVLPPDLPELDLNAMKLAAQFAAKNGPSFEHGLLMREARNPMFAFLEPRHSLHSTYRRLVDCFERAILIPNDLDAQLAALSDQSKQLALALDRWTFQAEQRQQQTQHAAEDEEMRQINASVDWHDFALVGELTFDGDDVNELPPIVSVQLLRQLARLEATSGANNAGDGAAAAGGGDMDMDEEASADMDMSGDDAATAAADIDPRKIRDTFVRTSAAAAAARSVSSSKLQVCPRCGIEIPIDEMAEHMRIELLDPKYIEERKRNEEKTRERSYADPSQVASNLKRLAQKRNEMAGGGAVDDAPRLAALQKPLASMGGAAAAAAAMPEQFDSIADYDEPATAAASTTTLPLSMPTQLPPVPVQLPPVPMPSGWMPGLPLPADFKMPPMPPGWMPGMPLPPIPGFMAAPPTHNTAAGATPSFGAPPVVLPPIGVRHDDAAAATAAASMSSTGVAGDANNDDNDDGEGDGAAVGEVAAPTWAKQVPQCSLRVEAVADTSKAAAGWGLAGQTIELVGLDTLSTTVERVKALLSAQLGGMPVKKQKLLWTRRGIVLKDTMSLAALNFGEQEALAVSTKTRGGRRK